MKMRQTIMRNEPQRAQRTQRKKEEAKKIWRSLINKWYQNTTYGVELGVAWIVVFASEVDLGLLELSDAGTP
jgi:hypothetical protein